MTYEIICSQRGKVGSHSWHQIKIQVATLLWAYGKSVHHGVTTKNKTDHSITLEANVREVAVTRVSQSPLGHGPSDIRPSTYPLPPKFPVCPRD